jgi:hypothetical protein
VSPGQNNGALRAIESGRRSVGENCLSDLFLDRLAVGELSDTERASASAHLGACTACTAAQSRLALERETFAREANLAQLAAGALARAAESPARAPLILRRLVPFGMLAGMAALAILLGPVDGSRTKGGFSLSPYVLHPERGSSGALHLGEPLHPGDKLQFRYNGGQGGYLAVVAVDATGKVSVYYPPGAAAARVEAGRDVALESAVELDGTLGSEVIVAVRCDEALPVSAVAQAAARAAEAAKARGVAPTDLGPLGLPCVETRHRIAKAERPAR